MDEVDKIIIHSLRQINCNLDVEVSSLTNFTPELLVNTVAACLQEIKPKATLPQCLPDGMAQRFAVASTLAEACSAAGYRNDIGYQTFLYPNVVDVRKLFMFLIEMLPKDRGEATDSDVDSTNGGELARLERDIKSKILQSLHAPWVPAYCRQRINRRSAHSNTQYVDFKPRLNVNIPSGLSEPADNNPIQAPYLAPNIFQQMTTGDYDIISSVLHKHDMDAYQPKVAFDQFEFLKATTSQTISHVMAESMKTEGLANDLDETAKIAPKRQTPMEQLSDHVNVLKHEYDELNTKRKGHNFKINKLKSLQSTLQLEIVQLRKLIKMHERTCVVLEQPTENVDKLKGLVEAAQEKRRSLEQQWQAYRAPLEQRMQELHQERPKNLKKNALDMRELIVQLETNMQEKSAMHTQLGAELKRSNHTAAASRKEYTRRIMEFIGNIRKQRNDIYKVLDDTRDLQKQIKIVSAQLLRQFNYTDDLLFKSAKHDAHSRRAYKLLATLHAACNELVTLVTQTGNVTKAIRNLEESIECERIKNIAVNLEKISFDIKNFENVIKNIQAKIYEVENRITEG